MSIAFPYYVIDQSLRLEASTGLCEALQQQIGTDLPAEFQDFINEYGGLEWISVDERTPRWWETT